MAFAESKATKISLFSLKTPQMRTFHLTWFAFFLAFFGWFGIAPLMAIVRDDLGLTKAQVGNTIIASVAIPVVARLAIGWLCDRIGPRLAYSGLLVLGSIPVMSIGLAQSYESFLLFRLAIGVIGASFVITQYHTSVMFAPNVVGTANATTAGWGNLGGGVTQMVMPLVLAGVLMFGVGETFGWRVAMVIPGVALLLVGIAYYFFTQDSPEGNYAQLRAEGRMPSRLGCQRDVPGSRRRLPRLGAVHNLRRLLWRRADHQQHRGALLPRQIRAKRGDGGPHRGSVRPDEHLRPHHGRSAGRQSGNQGRVKRLRVLLGHGAAAGGALRCWSSPRWRHWRSRWAQ